MPRHARPLLLLLGGVLLAACAGPRPRADGAASTSAGLDFPQAFYRAPPAEGRVFRLDPARSEVQVLVFRAGALARRGHNHLLRAQAFQGAVFVPADGLARARMDLLLPVASLEVDPPSARADAGAAFAAEVDDGARAGTRENLLGSAVLDAAAHPHVAVHARVLGGELPWLVLEASFTVHGVRHRTTLPVRVDLDGSGLRARGMLLLAHADVGLVPFQALGGLLQVADPLVLRFDLRGAAQDNAR